MTNRKKQDPHPEQKTDEVWITNASDDTLGRLQMVGDRMEMDYTSDWDAVGWKSKRRGDVAYDIHGKAINGMYPIFVKRKELEKAGINPDGIANL